MVYDYHDNNHQDGSPNWYTDQRYIRTLIHVLSLALRDQSSQSSIGYILVSDSSALNQQPSIRTWLTLFLYSLLLSILPVDYTRNLEGAIYPSTHHEPDPEGH